MRRDDEDPALGGDCLSVHDEKAGVESADALLALDAGERSAVRYEGHVLVPLEDGDRNCRVEAPLHETLHDLGKVAPGGKKEDPRGSAEIRQAKRKGVVRAPAFFVGDRQDPRFGLQVRPRDVKPDVASGIHGEERDIDAGNAEPACDADRFIRVASRRVKGNDILRGHGQGAEQPFVQNRPKRSDGGRADQLVEDNEAHPGEVNELRPRPFHQQPICAERRGAGKDGHDEVRLVLHRGKQQGHELLLHVLLVPRRDDVDGGHDQCVLLRAKAMMNPMPKKRRGTSASRMRTSGMPGPTTGSGPRIP